MKTIRSWLEGKGDCSWLGFPQTRGNGIEHRFNLPPLLSPSLPILFPLFPASLALALAPPPPTPNASFVSLSSSPDLLQKSIERGKKKWNPMRIPPENLRNSPLCEVDGATGRVVAMRKASASAATAVTTAPRPLTSQLFLFYTLLSVNSSGLPSFYLEALVRNFLVNFFFRVLEEGRQRFANDLRVLLTPQLYRYTHSRTLFW